MRLDEDERKILMATILEDLDVIERFLSQSASLEERMLEPDPFPNEITKFIASLALGKASIVRMLISKTKGARPSEAGMELIARWERIEYEIIKNKVNNEQED